MHLQQLGFDLRLQASEPSNQVCPTFVSPTLPQFRFQAPPGAQQLTRPDFLNVPQFGHIETPSLFSDVVIGVIATRHLASHR